MKESAFDRLLPEQIEPVHELYRTGPFCNPEHPLDEPDSIIFNFDPHSFATPSLLREQSFKLYVIEKQRFFFSKLNREEGDTRMDLTDRAALEGMHHHVLVHSGAGLMRWGTSDTYSIPYWDREAFHQAALLQYDREEAERITSTGDALNINFLRTFVTFLGDRTGELARDVCALEEALGRGQETRVSIASRQQEQLAVVMHEHGTFKTLLAAKLKHLLWLVDQQKDPAIRHGLMKELLSMVDAAGEAGVVPADLTIDMGVDTGISEDSYRPAYVISGFKQLSHLDMQTHSLPQEQCHLLDLETVLRSINRTTSDAPTYEDGRYKLPWKEGHGNA